MIKAGLIVVGIWSLCLFAVSLLIVGAFGPLYAGSFYPATLLFIIPAGICVIVATVGLAARNARPAAFWLGTSLHGLLFLGFRFAMNRWPGGDDGPGLAWLFVVGAGSSLASFVAVVFIVAGFLAAAMKGKSTVGPG